jgi:hypothetical protein
MSHIKKHYFMCDNMKNKIRSIPTHRGNIELHTCRSGFCTNKPPDTEG